MSNKMKSPALSAWVAFTGDASTRVDTMSVSVFFVRFVLSLSVTVSGSVSHCLALACALALALCPVLCPVSSVLCLLSRCPV